MSVSLENLIQKRFFARNFCTSFEVDSSIFEAQVEGLGNIPLPIQPKIAKKLIQLASPSKFGFKENTLYDPSVRKSFEISSDKIHLGHGFLKHLSSALEHVKQNLLLPADAELKADLHNMLIYEKGCFFELHQDSEKEDGMIASMVIVLPSNYQGGELVIEYQGQRKTLGEERYGGDFHPREKLQFMAFYTDCHHKLQKIRSGYRIALTFNIILNNPKETEPDGENSGLIKAIKEYFATNQDQPSYIRNSPKWLVYFLNHQYTQRSLNWKNLKGVDKQTAAAFKQVAKKLDLEVYLSLADVKETWSAFSKHDEYYSNPYDDEFDDTCEEDFDIHDLINTETTLDEWLDENGQPVNFGSCYVTNSMIFTAQENDEYNPYESEYEGNMGNYGNTLDRWYKRSALILWPKKNSLASKYAINANLAIRELIHALKTHPSNGLAQYEGLKSTILTQHELARIEPRELVALLLSLNTLTHLEEVFKVCTLSCLLKFEAKDLEALLSHFGDNAISQLIQPDCERTHRHQDIENSYTNILGGIYSDYPLTTEVFLRLWTESLITSLEVNKQKLINKKDQSRYLEMAQKKLLAFIKVLNLVDKKSNLEIVFNSLYKLKENFGVIFLYEILSAKNLKSSFKEISNHQLLEKEAHKIINAILAHPLDSSSWTIDELPACECDLCIQLKIFLSSNSEREKVWPISQDKRAHIHQIIDALQLPVSHTTMKIGSPHRLILKKEEEILKWRKNRYASYRKLLS